MTAVEQSEPIIHGLAVIPVSVDDVARGFDVTEKTVRSWIRSGLEVVKAGGKGRGNGAQLDLWQVIHWYLEENALDVAKTRLASAQADKHEMENAVRRGELADVKAVEREWSDLVMAFRAKMLSMPTKLGPQLTNVADPAILAARLRTEVNNALVELADAAGSEPEPVAPARAKARAATATADGKRVGGRKATTQQRKQRGAGTLAN